MEGKRNVSKRFALSNNSPPLLSRKRLQQLQAVEDVEGSVMLLRTNNGPVRLQRGEGDHRLLGLRDVAGNSVVKKWELANDNTGETMCVYALKR